MDKSFYKSESNSKQKNMKKLKAKWKIFRFLQIPGENWDFQGNYWPFASLMNLLWINCNDFGLETGNRNWFRGLMPNHKTRIKTFLKDMTSMALAIWLIADYLTVKQGFDV